MNDDALESLLRNADRSNRPAGISSEELAAKVRRRHAARRRRRDRCVRGALFVGCYVAGVMSVWAWSEATGIDSGERKSTASPVTTKTVTKNTAVPPRDQQEGPVRAMPAFDVDAETPYERYRRLGDVALMQDRDVDLAVEFYRRALKAGSKSERGDAIEGDSWVLIQLKQGQLDTSL